MSSDDGDIKLAARLIREQWTTLAGMTKEQVDALERINSATDISTELKAYRSTKEIVSKYGRSVGRSYLDPSVSTWKTEPTS